MGIHILVLKALLPGPFAHHVTTIFNILLRLRATHSHWNHALVVMLPKGSTGVAARCRPVCNMLMPMLRIIFEKIIHPSATASQSHLAQSGFTNLINPSTLTTSRSLTLWLPSSLRCHARFLLTTTPHTVRQALRRCIHYLFFSNLTSPMIVNGVKSRMIGRRRVLFKDTILSPPLFNIYLNR